MVLLQINLTDEENKIIEIYKAMKKYNTKEETIKDIIRLFKQNFKRDIGEPF